MINNKCSWLRYSHYWKKKKKLLSKLTVWFLLKWVTWQPSMVLGICALQMCKYTTVSSKHTWNSGQPFAAVPGEQLEVRCFAQGQLTRGHWKWTRALFIHSPHQYFLPVMILKPVNFGLQVRLSKHVSSLLLSFLSRSC